MVFKTPFPFTLFGYKPISLGYCARETHPIYFVESSYEHALQKNFEVWKKHAYLFPSNKFAIIENSYNGSNQVDIVCINKHACLQIIQDYLAQFQEVLGKEVNAMQLLNKIISSSDFSREVLKTIKG